MQPNPLYFGDCLDIMQEYIPDESVDLTGVRQLVHEQRVEQSVHGGKKRPRVAEPVV